MKPLISPLYSGILYLTQILVCLSRLVGLAFIIALLLGLFGIVRTCILHFRKPYKGNRDQKSQRGNNILSHESSADKLYEMAYSGIFYCSTGCIYGRQQISGKIPFPHSDTALGIFRRTADCFCSIIADSHVLRPGEQQAGIR